MKFGIGNEPCNGKVPCGHPLKEHTATGICITCKASDPKREKCIL